MLTPRRVLFTALAAVASAGISSAALANPLELNPGSTNGGAGTLDTVCTGACATANYPFTTANSTTAFSSDLHISGTPGSTGSVGFQETGAILIETFSVISPAGGNSNVTTNYNVYGQYTISGSGSFGGTSTYTVSAASATVNLVGSPGNNSTSHLNFTTPTPGTFGVTPGGADFSLGTAILTGTLLAPSAGGSCTSSAACTGQGSTQFSGTFTYVPNAGTFGPKGFMVNITGPFQLSIGANDGGNPLNTTETVANGGTDFVTGIGAGGCTGTGFSGSCPAGGGSLSYVVSVPEPGTVAVLSFGLLCLGVVLRRRVGRA